MANWSDPRMVGAPPAAAGAGSRDSVYDAGLRSYMLSVYNYMASGVLLTGVVALLFAQSGMAQDVMFGPGITKYLIIFAPLAFVMAMSFGLNKMSTGTLQMLFWGFATVMGLSMSTIFLVYTGASIAQTFFATAAAFAGLSLWGYTTKKDLWHGYVPDHGTGWIDRRIGHQHFHAVGHDGTGHQLCRRADLCRSDRL